MPLITATEYPMVRAAIDVSLGSRALKDEVIALDMYAGEAERQVIDRDPLALTYSPTSDNGKRVRNAAVYLTAAYLIPSLPNITSERFTDYSYTKSATDWSELAKRLIGLANQLLADVTGTALGTATGLASFRLARGRRGR